MANFYSNGIYDPFTKEVPVYPNTEGTIINIEGKEYVILDDRDRYPQAMRKGTVIRCDETIMSHYVGNQQYKTIKNGSWCRLATNDPIINDIPMGMEKIKNGAFFKVVSISTKNVFRLLESYYNEGLYLHAKELITSEEDENAPFTGPVIK